MNIDIADLSKVTLGPYDTVIVKVDGAITRGTAQAIKEEMAKGFPGVSADRLVVIDRSISLHIITQEDA